MPKRNALQSLIDGSLSGKRPQEVCTPSWMWLKLQLEWGFIACDVCSNYGCNVDADAHWLGPRWDHIDGLVETWPPFSFCNPEFDKLKLWMPHAAEQQGPLAFLTPVRPHRKWYRRFESQVDAVIEFSPFAFEFHKHTFPAPLALLCKGWIPSEHLWLDHGDIRFPCGNTGARHAPQGDLDETSE